MFYLTPKPSTTKSRGGTNDKQACFLRVRSTVPKIPKSRRPGPPGAPKSSPGPKKTIFLQKNSKKTPKNSQKKSKNQNFFGGAPGFQIFRGVALLCQRNFSTYIRENTSESAKYKAKYNRLAAPEWTFGHSDIRTH